MPKLIKFSKPSGILFTHKQSYFDNKLEEIAAQKVAAELYLAQPKRTQCKNCLAALTESVFYKNNIPYFVCDRCTHINGGHEDTEEYCRVSYIGQQAETYAADYIVANTEAYTKRVKDIYLPKAQFLVEALQADHVDPFSLTYADIGAGAGHFVAGLTDAGLRAKGYEVSEIMVSQGKTLRPDMDLALMQLDDTVSLARTVDADVVTLIGVLEHVRQPREVIEALRTNPKVKYVFIFVPLFSPTAFIEMVFPRVVQRLLYGEHTHVYTEGSLTYLQKEFGMRSVGEWWFGADAMDLYRSILNTVAEDSRNAKGLEMFRAMFVPLIDPLQAQIDQQKKCSEVHMLLSFDK